MEIKQPTDEKKERDASFFWLDVVRSVCEQPIASDEAWHVEGNKTKH